MGCDQQRRTLLGALLSTPALAVPLSAFALPKTVLTVNMALAYLNRVAFKASHERGFDDQSPPLG